MIILTTSQGNFLLHNCKKIDFYWAKNDFAQEKEDAYLCYLTIDESKITLAGFEDKVDAVKFIRFLENRIMEFLMKSENDSWEEIELQLNINLGLENLCK